MNIFVILLMALFMAGYYFIDAPNRTIPGESRTEAAKIAELKAVLSCVLRAHSDAMMLDESSVAGQDTAFSTKMPCAERYGIKTVKLCSDDKRISAACAPDKADKSISNYVITTTGAITDSGAGKVLEILAEDYPYAANFGIISMVDKVPYIMSSGGKKREISKIIAGAAAFANGELAYITQYKISGQKSPVIAAQLQKIKCAIGEMSIFRQNQWTCVPANAAPICSGDYIWNLDSAACVPDDSKRPLCGSNQSAVMVDDVWECIDPQQQRTCPNGTTARMNYDLMEWECAANADDGERTGVKKCDRVYDSIYGGGTTTLRGSLVSCNDCEKMIVHDDCSAECIPDAAATGKKSCYDGTCQNFYFGFPSAKYIDDAKKNLPELADIAIPMSNALSRNRKFNCMECPFGIDDVASLPPYVIICK